MKVLIELRPALDGFSGIPQETRLLFRGLASLEGIEVSGLLQSSNLVIDPGLPVKNGVVLETLSPRERIDRLSRVVVSMQQGPMSNRIEGLRRKLARAVRPALDALAGVAGKKVALGAFDATHYGDYLWRALFANSLPSADYELVVTRAFRVLRWPWAILHGVGVASAAFGRALYPRLDTSGFDVLLVETPFPGRVTSPTRMIVRYHDAIPLMMPHTIKDRGYHRAAHYEALRRNVRDGAWFACVSEATRRDLLSVMPELGTRAVTIPNMVSHHYFDEETPFRRVAEIIWSRKNRSAPFEGGAPLDDSAVDRDKLRYLLMVCTIEPRKNHLALVDAWEKLRGRGFENLHLVFVGSFGWNHESILQRCAPWLERGGLHLLENVPSDDLRALYRHAEVTVCPSFGEGFDFPGIEAMRSGGVVAASDIPVHRDIYGDGSEYFNPYAPADLADMLARLMDPAASSRRSELVQRGAVVGRQYLAERVLPLWNEFLGRVGASGS